MAALRSPKNLVLVHAPLVSRDLSGEFERLGWNVVGVRPEELGLETIASLAHDRAPAAFVGINHSPELAWAVTRTGTRYVSWTVDPLPLDRMGILEGTASDLVSVFLHRSSQVGTFRSLGFTQVEWLPLAAPAHRFDVQPPASLDRLPPSFVGSSLLDELALYQDATGRWGWSPDLARAVETTLEPLVELALADCTFSGFRPDGADLPGSLLAIAPSAPDVVAEALNAWISARMRRGRLAGPRLRDVVVHGDGGWQEVVGDRWKGPLADGRDMTLVYGGSLASIDVPRIHQRDIATLRAFDVAAAGGCLVAEPSADLCRVFEEGREFLAYRDGSELESILRELGDEPALGMEIGAKARRRADRDHRLARRAQRLLESVP